MQEQVGKRQRVGHKAGLISSRGGEGLEAWAEAGRSGPLVPGAKSGLDWIKDKENWKGMGLRPGRQKCPRKTHPGEARTQEVQGVQVGHRVPRASGESQEGAVTERKVGSVGAQGGGKYGLEQGKPRENAHCSSDGAEDSNSEC